jgi:hypothetical protein
VFGGVMHETGVYWQMNWPGVAASATQASVVHRSPSSQLPVPAQSPVDASHWPQPVHETGVPMQAPLASQVSSVVQALPSSHVWPGLI